MLKSRLDASDIVQETLLEAYQDRGQFRGHTPEERMGWLRRRFRLTGATADWGGAGGFADDVVDGALAALERRALWARFGL